MAGIRLTRDTQYTHPIPFIHRIQFIHLFTILFMILILTPTHLEEGLWDDLVSGPALDLDMVLDHIMRLAHLEGITAPVLILQPTTEASEMGILWDHQKQLQPYPPARLPRGPGLPGRQ